MEILSTVIGDYHGADWAGMVLMCLSLYMLGNKSKFGFIVGIASCFGWLAYGIQTGSIPDISTQFIVASMHIRGFRRWHISPVFVPQTS